MNGDGLETESQETDGGAPEHRQETPHVSIVVVNWNNYEETAECVRALNRYEYPEYEVIVVDNGSTDKSGDRLAKEFEWCEFVFNEENRGFGGGCNAGISAALENNTDYVLLINNDAKTSESFLNDIIEVADRAPAQVIGALIEDEHGNEVNGGPCHYPDMLFYSGYRDSLPFFPKISSADRGDWWMTDRIEGAGVILPANLLQKRMDTVGYYLDESLFMYCEEVELGLWCQTHSEPSIVTEHAVIHHEGGASSGRDFQLYYLTRNRVLIANEYMDTRSWIVYGFAYLIWKVAFAGRYAIKGKFAESWAILRGLWDGFRQKSGEVW